ncbi:MAG TPA: zinc-binding alcohol dehydrogenase family protein [Rhizomicrobium sp.]
MKAAVYYENGPPSVLKYEDVPDPKVFPGGLLIRVEAIAIEGGDVLNRAQGALMGSPHIVGYQCAGEIIELGEGITGFKVGQKVVTTNAFGSHAELRVVPSLVAWPLPPGMDVKAGAVIPVPFGTADDCLFEFGHLKKGGTALIQAGAGGVGVAAIQLAKRAGARVFATASSDERLEQLKSLGMDHGINYRTEDVVKAVMKLTGNQGVDVVVDPVGSTLQASIACLGNRGVVSLVGHAGREDTLIDARPLMQGNKSVTGVFLGAEIATPRVHNNIQRLIDEAARGELKVVIDKTFPLSEAAAAHAYIESRAAVGRVLLIP